jgi:uncharacterized protein YndB with AHSA1/START domain
MTTRTRADVATQVYQVYIRATPQKIWDAITTPEWTAKYGYQGPVEYDLRPGGSFKAFATPTMVEMGLPEVIVDGEVLEADPPNRLVQTYRFLFNDEHVAEGFTRLTYEITEASSEFSRLRVIHEVEGAPMMAAAIASDFSEQGEGGWGWILSDLKTVLETGSSMWG